MTHGCLNSLLAFALLGMSKTIQAMFKRFQTRYSGALSFIAALALFVALMIGLLMGAFNE